MTIAVGLTGCEAVTNGSVQRTAEGFGSPPAFGPQLVAQLERLVGRSLPLRQRHDRTSSGGHGVEIRAVYDRAGDPSRAANFTSDGALAPATLVDLLPAERVPARPQPPLSVPGARGHAGRHGVSGDREIPRAILCRALGALAGLRAGDAADVPPRVSILRRAILRHRRVLVARVRCAVLYHAWLQVDDKHTGSGAHVTLTGSRLIGVARRRLSDGPLNVQIYVRDGPVIPRPRLGLCG